MPAQWTDIYNFIYRRRLFFLMQFLDDELANQICGLLLSIHIEDMAEELEEEKPLSEQSPGLRKMVSSQGKDAKPKIRSQKKNLEELLSMEQDFSIEENDQFKDHVMKDVCLEFMKYYSKYVDWKQEGPYLYELVKLLGQDSGEASSQMLYSGQLGQMSQVMKLFRPGGGPLGGPLGQSEQMLSDWAKQVPFGPYQNVMLDQVSQEVLESDPGTLSQLNPLWPNAVSDAPFLNTGDSHPNFIGDTSELKQKLAQGAFWEAFNDVKTQRASAQQALAQRSLRRAYVSDSRLKGLLSTRSLDSFFGLLDAEESGQYYSDVAFRKREEMRMLRSSMEDQLQSETAFVMINSYGGSVGNGIMLHDALQFVGTNCVTVGMGVVASAASLVLAAGSIGDRLVTEVCHVMIHQPEATLNGQASDVWIDSQEVLNIRSRVADIYSMATYRPRHRVLYDLDRDFFLTADETLLYGLADEIATTDVMQDIIERVQKEWEVKDQEQETLLDGYEARVRAQDSNNMEAEAG